MASLATSNASEAAELETFHQRRGGRRGTRHLFWRLALLAEIAAILLSWELAVTQFKLVRAAFLPPPSAVAIALLDLVSKPTFAGHLAFSIANLLIGVALASLLGVTIGLAVGWSRLLELTIAPILWTLYAIPMVALAPLIILGLGLGPPSKIFLVFLLGFFPIALNAIEGVKTVDPSLISAARVYDKSGLALARTVVFPSTLPFILVGLKRAVALAFIGEMLGEFLGGGEGIGYLLQRAVFDFHMDVALAVVIIFVVFSNVGLMLVGVAQAKLAPWTR